MSYKFKVFTGSSGFDNPVDEMNELNEWLDKNPAVFLMDYQFSRSDKYHSICIRYCHRREFALSNDLLIPNSVGVCEPFEENDE